MLKRAEEIKSVETFRQRKQEKFSLRQVEADLRRSQLACEQLDSTVVSSRLTVPLVARQRHSRLSDIARAFLIPRENGSGFKRTEHGSVIKKTPVRRMRGRRTL